MIGAVRLSVPGRAEVWSWLPEGEIEPGAMDQVRNIAALPVAAAVAVMPDAHQGYGMPIGCVLATDGAVVPYAVGVDIGCGMIASRLSLELGELAPKVRAVLEGVYARVPVGNPIKRDRNAGSHAARQDSAVMRDWSEAQPTVLTPTEFRQGIRERADRQVGTLGGGNHFIELQADDQDRVWLMLHTGSRAFGKAICDRYHDYASKMSKRWGTPLPDPWLAFLPLDDPAGWEYMRDMQTAMDYATESRERIEHAVYAALADSGLRFVAEQRIETHHNFAAKEMHHGRPVIVHRKGAVRTSVEPRGTRKGEALTPARVTIPGSMQTGSYIGIGVVEGNAAVNSILTCSHGAGRRLGRNETRRQNVGVDIKAEMEAQGIVLICPPESDTLDEAGRAYKDIESVMAYQRDLVTPLVHLRPLGVVKG